MPKKGSDTPAPFYTPYNNILPATPLAGRPNYDPDLNKRVEWTTGRTPSRQVKKVENQPPEDKMGITK